MGFIASLRERGGMVARRGGLLAVAAVVSLAGLVFIAAAVAAAFTLILPTYLAILLAALLLLVVAAAFAAAGLAYGRRAPLTAMPDHSLLSKLDVDGWRKGLQHHSLNWLSGMAASNPRKALLAGLVAGGAILAIEALGRRIR